MNLVSRSEFARRAGVSPAAISKQFRVGGPLAAAGRGKRVDVDHPAAADYVAKQAVLPTSKKPIAPPVRKKEELRPPSEDEVIRGVRLVLKRLVALAAERGRPVDVRKVVARLQAETVADGREDGAS